MNLFNRILDYIACSDIHSSGLSAEEIFSKLQPKKHSEEPIDLCKKYIIGESDSLVPRYNQIFDPFEIAWNLDVDEDKIVNALNELVEDKVLITEKHITRNKTGFILYRVNIDRCQLSDLDDLFNNQNIH